MHVFKKSNTLFRYKSIFLFTAALAIGNSHAAMLTLTNGDRLTGEVVTLSDGILTFKSSVFDEINVPWKHVRELSTEERVTVQLSNGETAQGLIVLDEAGYLTVEQADLADFKFQKNDVEFFNPPRVDPSMKYSGRADFSGLFNRGNSKDDALNLDTEFIARNPENRYTLAAEVNQAESVGAATVSNRYLLLKYDAFLNERDYLFINAKGENDNLADLSLRTSVGAGYGRQFIETERTKLSAEAGLSHVRENYELAPDASFPSVNLGLNYERKVWNKKLVFFNNNNLAWSLESKSDALFKTKLGLRVPILDNVNLATQLNVDYDNTPAFGIEKTDSSLNFSLGYGF